MSLYFYYQVQGGEEKWHEALAEHRAAIIEKYSPRYSTILSVDILIDEDTPKEAILAAKYSGDLYFDFDSAELDTATTQVQKFIKKLEDLEVDLSMVSFYATGKKGYHVTIPFEVISAKNPSKGFVNLPAVYKEMAFGLYVDTLDLVVYSARKGRMFRTVNVERENGRYKVQVTAQEIKDMDDERYLDLTSKPRALIKTTTPTLHQKLAVRFSAAEDKVSAAAKRRGDNKKDVEALARFKGQFPETLQKLMNGEMLAEGAGFNKIAMQLGIAAGGLGKSEEDYIAACQGLITKHQGDGIRYNSESKREAELRRMFEYTKDNVCYSYSVGAIKSLIKPGEITPDLDGFTELQGTPSNGGDEFTDESIYGGVFTTPNGIYKRGEEAITQVCDLAYENVQMLVDIDTGNLSGYEGDMLFKGISKGRKRLGVEHFASKAKFQPVIFENSGIFTGNDNQLTAFAGRTRDKALKNNSVVNIIHKEGLDIITTKTDEGHTVEMVWAGPTNVFTLSNESKYRFEARLNTAALYRSDLADAPKYAGTPESTKVIAALLDLNNPYSVGSLLGWMVSCFHKQIYQRYDRQFPLCQVYGQAGSGKSTTVYTLMHIFYYLTEPKVHSANGNTKFGDASFMQSSASLPYAIDEYKPRQLTAGRLSDLKTLFREAYNSGNFNKGGGSSSGGSDWNNVQTHSYSAPLIFMGEAIEAETAILERTVSVELTKAGIAGRSNNIQIVQDGRHILSALGKDIVMATFGINLENFRTDFVKLRTELSKELSMGQDHRSIHNIAVTLNGLKFLKRVLNTYHGEAFDEKLDLLMHAVRNPINHPGLTVMSEAAKVLNTLSYMARSEDPRSDIGLESGKDYVVGTGFIEVRVKDAYIKYATWQHRKGFEALYDNEDAFAHGLSSFVAVTDRVCTSSMLKTSPLTKVLRFDTNLLASERVEAFI